MNTEKYLRRIVIENSDISPTVENLKILQRQHLLTVPFENLDIHWKRQILLDTTHFYDKIVGEKRGGFCYELNGLFNELLNKLGFPSRIISARVFQGNNKFGAEYDHLAILTKIDDDEFLVDVGFGDFAAEPLLFIPELEQRDRNGTFSIIQIDKDEYEVLKKSAEGWSIEYKFRDLARNLPEFSGMCEFHQTSPESHFTQGKICSLMLENGRKTLSNKAFIETKNGEKGEKKINSEDEFYTVLEREFRIEKSF